MSTWWVNDTRRNRPLTQDGARMSVSSYVSNDVVSTAGGERAPAGGEGPWQDLLLGVARQHAWTQTRDPNAPDMPETGVETVEDPTADLQAPPSPRGSEARVSVDGIEEGGEQPGAQGAKATRGEAIKTTVNA